MEQLVDNLKTCVESYKAIPADGSKVQASRAVLSSLLECRKFIKESEKDDRGQSERFVRDLTDILAPLPMLRALLTDRNRINKIHSKKEAEDFLDEVQNELDKGIKEFEDSRLKIIQDWVRFHPVLKGLKRVASKRLPKEAYVLLFEQNEGEAPKLVTRANKEGKVLTRFHPREFSDESKLYQTYHGKAPLVGAAVISKNELLQVIGKVPEGAEGQEQLKALTNISKKAVGQPGRDFVEKNQVLRHIHSLCRKRKVDRQDFILLFESADLKNPRKGASNVEPIDAVEVLLPSKQSKATSDASSAQNESNDSAEMDHSVEDDDALHSDDDDVVDDVQEMDHHEDSSLVPSEEDGAESDVHEPCDEDSSVEGTEADASAERAESSATESDTEIDSDSGADSVSELHTDSTSAEIESSDGESESEDESLSQPSSLTEEEEITADTPRSVDEHTAGESDDQSSDSDSSEINSSESKSDTELGSSALGTSRGVEDQSKDRFKPSKIRLIIRQAEDGRVITRFRFFDLSDSRKLYELFKGKPPVVGAAVIRGNQLIHALGMLPAGKVNQSTIDALLEQSKKAMEQPAVSFVTDNEVLVKLQELNSGSTMNQEVVLFVSGKGRPEPLSLTDAKGYSKSQFPLSDFRNPKFVFDKLHGHPQVIGASVISQPADSGRYDPRSKGRPDRDNRDNRQDRSGKGSSSGPSFRGGPAGGRQSRPTPVVLHAIGQTPLKQNILLTPETLKRLDISISLRY